MQPGSRPENDMSCMVFITVERREKSPSVEVSV